MFAFFGRVLQWIPLNIVSLLGIVQAVIKLLKEIVTALVNIIFPFTPDNGKFETVVLKIRGYVDALDRWVEKGKAWILGALGIPALPAK
jgi:hypothetical protein